MVNPDKKRPECISAHTGFAVANSPALTGDNRRVLTGVKMGLLILTLILVFTPMSTWAASSEGPGARTCQQFLDEKKQDPSNEDFYFAWAEGYMSGLNVAKLNDTKGGFEAMPVSQQKEHINSFCTENPNKKFTFAVIDLYKKIYPPQ